MITHKKILCLGCLLFLLSCSSAVKYADSSTDGTGISIGKSFRGAASYYADKFNGRITASGDIFDNSKLTAAHKTLPFYTKARVTNLRNNKWVNVLINDRGPFVEGRIIDLSKAAAEAIGMLADGVVEVEIEIIE